MKIRAALLASLFAMTASSAFGAITYTATTLVNGSPQPSNNVSVAPGDTIAIQVTLRSDGEEVFALGAAATGYNDGASIISFDSGQSQVDILVQQCFPSFGCLGGLSNNSTTLSESLSNPLGPEIQFINAVATSGNTNTGANDFNFDGTEAGGPQTQIVFTAGSVEGSTTVVIGADPNYGDDSIGSGGASLTTTGDSVTITVPEPTAVAAGLVALLSVGGVATARRKFAA